MASLGTEHVLDVRHWNESLFSFRTTRDDALRFENGHFVMLGLEVDGRPLLRAYSIASPNYAEHLEFFSIKVADGKLTSRLQHIKAGDPILVGRKPTGTLLTHDLLPGKRLYLLATGTGLAPFLSIVQDPELYDRFERVVLVHGVRHISELAYGDFLREELPNNEYFGEEISAKLTYYPTVTREPYRNRGRITDLLASNQLTDDLDLPPLDPEHDRVMICGSMGMLADTKDLLDARGFTASPHIGVPGHYVVERAFVEQ